MEQCRSQCKRTLSHNSCLVYVALSTVCVVCAQAKAVPRSQDLTDQSLQQQEEEQPLGGAPLRISSTNSSSMPGRSVPKKQQQQGGAGGAGAGAGGGLVQEVELRGAKRTQQLIRQNQHLPAADKAALAEQERAKGNEHFRCAVQQVARQYVPQPHSLAHALTASRQSCPAQQGLYVLCPACLPTCCCACLLAPNPGAALS